MSTNKKRLKTVIEMSLENLRRPVVKLNNSPNTTALIDTGSTIPMFYLPKHQLARLGNGYKITHEHAKVGGIGHGEVCGKVCSLNNFQLGGIHYKPFDVFVPDEIEVKGKAVSPYPILFSSTMFEGMKYDFDTINHKFTVEIPEDMSEIVEFRLAKNFENRLFPIVNGIFLQESAEVLVAQENYTQDDIDITMSM